MHLLGSIKDGLHRLVVGKALKKSAEVVESRFEGWVTKDIFFGVACKLLVLSVGTNLVVLCSVQNEVDTVHNEA